MNRKYDALPPSLPPRGLCREAAASYIGISPTKFDELVEDGRMPHPKRVDSRKVWDRSSLDAFFDLLPGGEGLDSNPWDIVTASSRGAAV